MSYGYGKHRRASLRVRLQRWIANRNGLVSVSSTPVSRKASWKRWSLAVTFVVSFVVALGLQLNPWFAIRIGFPPHFYWIGW